MFWAPLGYSNSPPLGVPGNLKFYNPQPMGTGVLKNCCLKMTSKVPLKEICLSFADVADVAIDLLRPKTAPLTLGPFKGSYKEKIDVYRIP